MCGFCGIQMPIEAVAVYDSGVGLELSCGHRNGFCDTCQIPVEDVSSDPNIIKPVCHICSPG